MEGFLNQTSAIVLVHSEPMAAFVSHQQFQTRYRSSRSPLLRSAGQCQQRSEVQIASSIGSMVFAITVTSSLARITIAANPKIQSGEPVTSTPRQVGRQVLASSYAKNHGTTCPLCRLRWIQQEFCVSPSGQGEEEQREFSRAIVNEGTN
jgi:hypothetical protein